MANTAPRFQYHLMSMLMALFFVGGCATAYISELRKEYKQYGQSYGIYEGRKEYPRVFPATHIAVKEEVPSWWKPSILRGRSSYELWVWPLGVTLSLSDVPISLVTDVVMLPYDWHKTKKHEEEKRKWRAKCKR